MKRILLINPPREDAFPEHPTIREEVLDEFVTMANQPIALLKIGTFLKQQGNSVEMIDCAQEVNYSEPASILRKSFVEYRSAGFKSRKRVFHLGMTYSEFAEQLKSRQTPDEIWISSCMTYHYKTTHKIINICKKIFPQTKVLLGGIYPTLCPEKAKESMADEIITGEIAEAKFQKADISLLPYTPEYAIIKITKGCPNNCSYCAVHLLEGNKMCFRETDSVFEEIMEKYYKYGIKKFVFWESNLLVNSKNYFEVILDKIIEQGMDIKISTPEGLAPDLLNRNLIKKMLKAGFYEEMIYLPLESIDEEMNKRFHRRLSLPHVQNAINYLLEEGHHPRLIGIFILMGFPEQPIHAVARGICFAWQNGVLPIMMPFTPIPGTEEYTRYQDLITHKDLSELHPLLFPFADKGISYEEMEELYSFSEQINPLYIMEFIQSTSIKKAVINIINESPELKRIVANNFIIHFQPVQPSQITDYLKTIMGKILLVNPAPSKVKAKLREKGDLAFESDSPAYIERNLKTPQGQQDFILDLTGFLACPSKKKLEQHYKRLKTKGILIVNVFSEYGGKSPFFMSELSSNFFSENFLSKKEWEKFFRTYFKIMQINESDLVTKYDKSYSITYRFVLQKNT